MFICIWITLWFFQTTPPSSSSLFMPRAMSKRLHHWKTKQILYCGGVWNSGTQPPVCCIGCIVNERHEQAALHYTIPPTSCTCLLSFLIILSFCVLLLFFSYSAFSPYTFSFHLYHLPLVFLLLSFLHIFFPQNIHNLLTNSTPCLCFSKHTPFCQRVCPFFGSL